MKIQTLNYFIQLSKMENLSQTADYFEISQPALSKQMKLLESELELQLFHRFGNHLKLSEAGRQYAAYVERALQLLDSGREYTKTMRYEISGHISLYFLTLESLFTPCISSYAALNPNVQFHLVRLRNEREIPLTEDADFIIYSHEPGQCIPLNKWYSDTLLEERYVLVMAPDHPVFQTFKMTGDLQLLRDASFITADRSGRYGQDITACICANAGFQPKSQLQTDDLLTTIRLIADGAGISFLPEGCTSQVNSLAPELQMTPVRDYCRSVSAAHQRKERMTEAARDFREYVLDYYREEILS